MVFEAFRAYREQFEALTRQARARFEERDWQAVRDIAARRLVLYRQVLVSTMVRIQRRFESESRDKWFWAASKAAYRRAVAHRGDAEIGETFFNSVTRRALDTVGVDPRVEFVRAPLHGEDMDADCPGRRVYPCRRLTIGLFEKIVADYGFGRPFEDLRRDARRAAARVEQHLHIMGRLEGLSCVEMLPRPFVRDKAAYLVGRMQCGPRRVPLILALLNRPAGLVIDAVLLEEDHVSILFSYTRASFFVETDRPRDLVGFLADLIPGKRVSELYTLLGFDKHGKTELYREILGHMDGCRAPFELSEGERGMVMVVFNSPTDDLVFKIIRDSFDYPKKTTRQNVMSRYDYVFRHDRAGRLVDAQSFEQLKFHRRCFAPELLETLRHHAAQSVRIDERDVVIRHAYVERRVVPLDVYLRRVDSVQAMRAVIDYGNAIKDLAVSDIFPGDMLLKNFGVTRLNRVVFYDYDELCALTECRFRSLSEAQGGTAPGDGPVLERVDENDIFPEIFRTAMGLAPDLRDVFMRYHGDLLEVDFWRDIQRYIRRRKWVHILPYTEKQRLAPAAAGTRVKTAARTAARPQRR